MLCTERDLDAACCDHCPAPAFLGPPCPGRSPSVSRAGLLAKKAVEAGLRVKPYIRTSLSPGGGMVTHYLSSSGVLPYLSRLG